MPDLIRTYLPEGKVHTVKESYVENIKIFRSGDYFIFYQCEAIRPEISSAACLAYIYIYSIYSIPVYLY